MRPALAGEARSGCAAEEALAAISGDFSEWMHDECDAARRRPPQGQGDGLSKQTRQELFLAAHDMKGDSGTLGYPEVGAAAESLCRLLEHTPDLAKIPLAIVDQHVDAVRAIVREHDRADIAAIAAALTGKLRAVTDEFLVQGKPPPPRRAQGDPESHAGARRVVLSNVIRSFRPTRAAQAG